MVACGAPNCQPGILTVYVPPGTLGIEKTTIGGVESDGMLASGQELGINRDHSGILELGSENFTLAPDSIVYQAPPSAAAALLARLPEYYHDLATSSFSHLEAAFPLRVRDPRATARTTGDREGRPRRRVLVSAASKYGATAEIAKIIGEVLRQDGLEVWRLAPPNPLVQKRSQRSRGMTSA